MPRPAFPASLTTLLVIAGSAALSACAALADTRAGGGDAGAASDVGGAVEPGADALVSGGDASEPAPTNEASFSGDGRSCLDFDDNNHDGIFDCDDPSCQSPSVNLACCVGSTLEVCCDAETTFAVVDGSCGATPCLALGGTPLTSTAGRVAMAPSPGSCGMDPSLVFAPFGRPAAHSFMVLPRQIDERAAHVRVIARLGVDTPTSAEVAAAGFGLFTEQGIGAVARPLLAVIASATSNDVRVVVGDRVIATRPLSSEGCGRSLEYALDVAPDGTFRVESRVPGAAWDEAPVAVGTCDVSADARVAMFGQQPNPDGAPVAWVSDLSVEQGGCDLLAPARRSGSVVASEAGDDVTGLSVFARTDGAYEALVTSGDQIHWLAVQSGSGGLVSRVAADPFADNIQPTWPGYGHFRDVEVVNDDGVVRVFLAAAAADGDFEIVRTTYTPAPTASEPGVLGSSLVRVLSAADFPAATNGAEAEWVDGPTVAAVPGVAGLVLAVRVHYTDGHDEIRIAPATPDDTDFETAAPSVSGRDATGITTNGLVHANQALDDAAFDRDELADPQLVVIDGVARVLFAGRRGTRWSIGSIVASPDFTHFIPVSDEPILGPNGTGFDALGVMEPTLIERGATRWLYYAGTDGARRSVGLAVQPLLGGT